MIEQSREPSMVPHRRFSRATRANSAIVHRTSYLPIGLDEVADEGGIIKVDVTGILFVELGEFIHLLFTEGEIEDIRVFTHTLRMSCLGDNDKTAL